MFIVKIRMTFVVALVMILTATGLWATGADEEPAAAADSETVFDPATGMSPPCWQRWWQAAICPRCMSGFPMSRL